MNKIIFCDKNKELVKKVKKVFEEEFNNTHCELVVSEYSDVLKTKKKYPNAKIITASNPDFTMSGGLDALLKKTYAEQCSYPREFLMTDDLFFTISVDKELKANEYEMMRVMFGAYMCSRKNDIILTGIGTGIGQLPEYDFIRYLTRLINSDFHNSNFRNSDFSNSNFSYSDFYNSNFSNSNFSYSDFHNSNFRNSDFHNSNFSNSDFHNSNFHNSNFSNSDFHNSNFSNSDFHNSDFSNPNFSYSDFSYSDFSNSNFSYSDFHNSNFSNSDFSYSDFHNSNFSNSNFSYSDFHNSNFSNSDFSYSNFSYSDFHNSNFRNSDFSYSDFSYSDFINSKFNYKITPTERKFIGWKKSGNKIIKLEIQNPDKVSGGFVGRKLRTNKVKVLEIQDLDGKKLKDKKIASSYGSSFIYKVGKIIEEPSYVHDDKIECTDGIHFFLTRSEAVEY